MDIGVVTVMGITLAVMLAVLVAVRIPGMLKDPTLFNSTDDWTPAPEYEQETPTMTSLIPHTLQLITSHLEAGETLEGFARAIFVPARPKDSRFGSGIEKLPLLVVATSRRILLFEITVLTVHRTCFIPYDQIESLEPPKPGILGTSGRMKFGLKSGREYQFGFHGPLLSEEGMRQEQSLAAYFRRIAPQFASSSGPRSSTDRAAA